MSERGFTEEQLDRIETARSPDSIPELVRALREHQRDLDSLRMKVEVALRDRDELRAALVRCREELRGRSGD